MFLLLLFALNKKNLKMTWHSKKLKTFQLYLYSIFFLNFFSFEKINSWLWRKKAIGLIYYLACVVVDIWSFLCEYDTILRWGKNFQRKTIGLLGIYCTCLVWNEPRVVIYHWAYVEKGKM